MKKFSSKRKALIIGVVTLLLIIPVTVYAIMYYSDIRQNEFIPAKANVQIKEDEHDPEDEHSSSDDEYRFTLSSNGNYSTNKAVQIHDERKMNDEYLKVLVIPSWYDSNGNAVANIEGVTDHRYKALNESETALEVYNGYGEAVITYLLDPYWKESWSYNDADGCFYYSGLIASGQTTSTLISGVEISPSVYNATDGYTLHVDILADAIQKYGDAVDNRKWSN